MSARRPAGEPEQEAQEVAFDQVEVRRSTRRRSTVSAYREDGRTVVLIPARMSRADERYWVEHMVTRLQAQEARGRPTDADLQQRARELSTRYLDGRAVPTSVRWANNQVNRWGSCTLIDGTIRLSTRLRGMPRYVVDYVLLHELSHLIVPDHSAAFWKLLEAYPRLERARGYLDGVSSAAGLDLSEDADMVTEA